MKHISEPQTWTSLNKQPKQQNMGMRFGTWYVRSLCRAGSLVSVSKLSKCKLYLVGVQESDGRAVSPNIQENTHFCTVVCAELLGNIFDRTHLL
jgi:hypothetical protein